jgi:regulator of nucleoside diphosphate kinase
MLATPICDYVERYDHLLRHRSAHSAALSAREPSASTLLAGRRIAPSGRSSQQQFVSRLPVQEPDRLEQKDFAVLPLPKIVLSASDYPRLEQVARVAARRGDRSAMFLMAEINRAEIVPDDAHDMRSIVTIGSWITYWTNWGLPRKTVHLVWPEELTSDLAHISILSPLGAALIGLHVGDQMPYFVAGCMNVIRIESVDGFASNVVPLVRAPVLANKDRIDDDPGPTAA